MDLTVQHLNTIGCEASGIIGDEDLVTAVRDGGPCHHYGQVILATAWVMRDSHIRRQFTEQDPQSGHHQVWAG